MKTMKKVFLFIIASAIFWSGCATMTKQDKGVAIGVVGGGVAGGVIGKAAGNTALGAIIGAAVGGVAGGIIGHKMDKQAEELKKELPNATIKREGEGIIVELSEKILFAFNSSDLSSGAKNNLDKILTVLAKYPDTNIEIQGHTDSKGTPEYNQNLSEKRAKAVYDYFIERNTSASRLTRKGFGETAPKYTNDTEDGRAQNRRVEFLITANEKMKAEAKKEAETK